VASPCCFKRQWASFFNKFGKKPLTPVLFSPGPCLVLYLCLPSSPWAYWDLGFPWKTCSTLPYNFLKLLPQLVCQAPQSKETLNQLLGTSRGRGSCKNKLQLQYSFPNSAPQGEEGKQTGALMHRDAGSWAQWECMP
jgi:hypothetical protein